MQLALHAFLWATALSHSVLSPQDPLSDNHRIGDIQSYLNLSPPKCPGVSAPNVSLDAAAGWAFFKIMGSSGSKPRGLLADSQDNLLMIDAGTGLVAHTLGPDGCISSSKTLIADSSLNHGLALAPDGATLYVSSETTAWRYRYNAASQTVSDREVIVRDIPTASHGTRTLGIAPRTPDLILVSVGSDGNLDLPAIDKSSGRSMIKVFDLAALPSGGHDYKTQGDFAGYGLRNDVAIAFDGNNMIWSVENGADQVARNIDGRETDIHNDNPAEELNFLGDPTRPTGKWYGYPTCFTVWDPSIPNATNVSLRTGSQFIPAPNSTFSDADCESLSTPPRLALPAHTAPIDAKFGADGNLYVTLHGSWNRKPAVGYKVVVIPFRRDRDGRFDPVAAADSQQGYADVLWQRDAGLCTARTCFRPSGLTFDRGFSRLFVASDGAEGEIYVAYKTG